MALKNNAAWRMKHKLLQVMKERDDSQPLLGYIQLDDAYWGGKHRRLRWAELFQRGVGCRL